MATAQQRLDAARAKVDARSKARVATGGRRGPMVAVLVIGVGLIAAPFIFQMMAGGAVASSDATIVTAALSQEGSAVLLTPVTGSGTATITDTGGAMTDQIVVELARPTPMRVAFNPDGIMLFQLNGAPTGQASISASAASRITSS